MIEDKRFIIIAGTARNVGKTTLACQIIQHLAQVNIVALKFITLKDDGIVHSHHKDIETFGVYKEKDLESSKDTVKMLKAGAKESYLLVCKEAYIEDAITDFRKRLSLTDVVVVESASLRNYISPKMFVIVDRKDAIEKKPYINKLMPLASHMITDIFDPKQMANILTDLE